MVMKMNIDLLMNHSEHFTITNSAFSQFEAAFKNVYNFKILYELLVLPYQTYVLQNSQEHPLSLTA